MISNQERRDGTCPSCSLVGELQHATWHVDPSRSLWICKNPRCRVQEYTDDRQEEDDRGG